MNSAQLPPIAPVKRRVKKKKSALKKKNEEPEQEPSYLQSKDPSPKNSFHSVIAENTPQVDNQVSSPEKEEVKPAQIIKVGPADELSRKYEDIMIGAELVMESS